ncbi:MAG: hypothetical protein Phyf2KO_26780 [Phycisphaerales bacterium]
MARRLHAGFTLIELLVVIAIVALLIGILLPALGKARESARSLRCLANERSMGQSVLLYQNDWDGHFPLSSHTTGSLLDSWLGVLEGGYGLDPAVKRCPEDEDFEKRPFSYVTNDHFEKLTPGVDYNPITGEPLPGGRRRAITRIHQVLYPSETAYAVEWAGTGDTDHLHSVGWEVAEEIPPQVAVTRHGDTSSNFIFTDGHAESLLWERVRERFNAGRPLFNPEGGG